jgi:hypothetical protein
MGHHDEFDLDVRLGNGRSLMGVSQPQGDGDGTNQTCPDNTCDTQCDQQTCANTCGTCNISCGGTCDGHNTCVGFTCEGTCPGLTCEKTCDTCHGQDTCDLCIPPQ